MDWLQRKGLIDGGELRRLLALMVPLYIANVMQLGMGVIDTIVAGAAGARHLAAVALGCSVTTPIMVAFGAVLSIVGPMVSMARGAGCGRKAGLLLNNAKILGCMLMAGEWVALYACSFIFDYVTDDPGLAAMARQYLYYLMLAVPASVMLRALQGNFEGHGQTRPAMLMSFCALLLNIPLNYAFVFGWWFIPAMGGPGCGLTTAIITWMMAFFLAGLMFASRQHRRNARQMWALRPMEKGMCRRIFKLGLPIGVASLCEMSFFCVVTLIIAPLGELMVSAQQVALNVSGIVFMLPFSLSIAASIRAAYHVGGQRLHAFNAMVRTLFISTYALVLIVMALIILLRRDIVALYTDNPVILETAQVLIIYCAVYQLSDATQALYGGLLRGCHDTAIITGANLACYWLVGLPLSIILIRTDWLVPAMGPAGAWVSFIVALTLVALCFAWRFRHTRQKVFRQTA